MYLLGSSVRQVPEGPQAVLHQTLAGACEVVSQSLHPTCREKTISQQHLIKRAVMLCCGWQDANSHFTGKKKVATPVWLLCTHRCVLTEKTHITYQPPQWRACCWGTQKALWAHGLWSTAASHSCSFSWCELDPQDHRWPGWSAVKHRNCVSMRGADYGRTTFTF